MPCQECREWTLVLIVKKIRLSSSAKKNNFLKEMVLLGLKRMIPMILLYMMSMLTKLICILAVTFSVSGRSY